MIATSFAKFVLMRLFIVFMLFCRLLQAQFPIVSIKMSNVQTLQIGSLYNAKNKCVGLNKEKMSVSAEGNKLIFRSAADSNGKFISKEQILLEFKDQPDYKLNPNPVIAIDKSNGPNRGRTYVCWSDNKNGKNNDDVFLIYSNDEGKSWTEPILVTYYPNHKKQFQPAININSENGDVAILYYDQQNQLQNNLFDVYIAISKNGGLKFESYKINDKPLKANPYSFNFIDSDSLNQKNEIFPAWYTINNKQQVIQHSTIINDSTIRNYYIKNNENLLQHEKTISFNNLLKLEFTSRVNTTVSAVITKPLDAGFEIIIFKNRKIKAGNNKLLIDTKKLGLKKETYVLTLYYNNKNSFIWLIN